MVFANVPLKLGYARSKRFAMYIDNGIVKAIEVRGRSKEGDRQRESDSERDGGGEKQRETAGETETEGETESETKDSVLPKMVQTSLIRCSTPHPGYLEYS